MRTLPGVRRASPSHHGCRGEHAGAATSTLAARVLEGPGGLALKGGPVLDAVLAVVRFDLQVPAKPLGSFRCVEWFPHHDAQDRKRGWCFKNSQSLMPGLFAHRPIFRASIHACPMNLQNLPTPADPQARHFGIALNAEQSNPPRGMYPHQRLCGSPLSVLLEINAPPLAGAQ